MRKTLFVSDLDGTLLDSEAKLSERTVDLLNAAIRMGANFTVATARTSATVDVLLKKVEMKLPAIVMTGAAMWHFEERRYSDLHFFIREDVEWLLRLFSEMKVYPFVYTLPLDSGADNHTYILNVYYSNPHPSDADKKFISLRNHLPLKRFIHAQPPEDVKSRTLLFFASGPMESLNELSSVISSERPSLSFSNYADVYNPGLGLIEVFAPNVSKALAIKKLKEELGMDKVVVFGDNLNDLPMFEIADVAVAVSNAAPETLSSADVIIGPNTSDSVARYILSRFEK